MPIDFWKAPSLLLAIAVASLPLVRSQGSVDGFVLVNTETNEDIGPLSDGDILHVGSLPPFSIVAITSGTANSVSFNFDDEEVKIENAKPWALTGDSAGDYLAWDPIPIGSHHLIATPYKRRRKKGKMGTPMEVTFTIQEDQSTTTSNESSTASPSTSPSSLPTDAPTITPSNVPSSSPTDPEQNVETSLPSSSPSGSPSLAPTTSSPVADPTHDPSATPSQSPTVTPSTSAPSAQPSNPPSPSSSQSPVSSSPVSGPTSAPTTSEPSSEPSQTPTSSPSTPRQSDRPSNVPSARPSDSPVTSSPISGPTATPTTSEPSSSPSTSPTESPSTSKPSQTPSSSPTSSPSRSPVTSSPIAGPTATPTTNAPSVSPSSSPSNAPTAASPSTSPSVNPSPSPSNSSPSATPSASPTEAPSASPSVNPSPSPSNSSPSATPSASPTEAPNAPTGSPSLLQNTIAIPESDEPSMTPTGAPVVILPPTITPSSSPSKTPSSSPTTSSPSASPMTPVDLIPLNKLVAGGATDLEACEGLCQEDFDCAPGYSCYVVNGTVPPGCSGTPIDGEYYCYDPPQGTLVWVGNNGGDDFPLGLCEGDCDNDVECSWGLNCFQRDGTTPVDGCEGQGQSFNDYCYTPPEGELVLQGNNGEPANAFPLQACQGDCDADWECDYGLVCAQRNDDVEIEGCTGRGAEGYDYCYVPPPNTLIRMGNNNDPPENFPLGVCEGDCDYDSDCSGDLICYHRSGFEAVPGCGGFGIGAWDYCADPANLPGNTSYIPGNGIVYQNGLQLSQGLLSRVIAVTGDPVPFDVGGASVDTFHEAPDGGAVFSRDGTPGYVYVSNSESFTAGGVGAIYFNDQGQVIDYKRVLGGTIRNCGGGKSFWNTWITCEEYDQGKVWEVDPWGSFSQVTVMGDVGAMYESAAYDNRDPTNPKFFVTIDEFNGPLLRFTPATAAVAAAQSSGDYSDLLTSTGEGVKHEYMVLNYDTEFTGTYTWTENITAARESAELHYQNAEGIDVYEGMLYVTTKVAKKLFIFDIDAQTFEETSTESGAFANQPDQVARIVNNEDILYFCEDGGEYAGVHGRSADGQYYTIFRTDSDPATNGGVDMRGETSGLAFSPDYKLMYVSYQSQGKILEVKRADGLPFNGVRIDIKYHEDDTNFEP